MHIRQQNFMFSQTGFQNEQRKFNSIQIAFNAELKTQLLARNSVEDKIDYLRDSFLELRESLISQKSLDSSAQITIQHSISGIRLQELLSFLANSTDNSLLDPQAAFQSSLILRNNRRRQKTSHGLPFWLTPKIQSWNQSKISSLIMIKGVRKSRFQIQDFLIDSISQLVDRAIPSIWTIKAGPEYQDGTKRLTPVVLLKSIISQAIELNPSLHNDASFSQPLNSFRDGTTESDYFNILASIVQTLAFVYIFIDIELISTSARHQGTIFLTLSPPTLFRLRNFTYFFPLSQLGKLN